jgi:hypothetical protein
MTKRPSDVVCEVDFLCTLHHYCDWPVVNGLWAEFASEPIVDGKSSPLPYRLSQCAIVRHLQHMPLIVRFETVNFGAHASRVLRRPSAAWGVIRVSGFCAWYMGWPEIGDC